MLVLSRSAGESITIGRHIKVSIVDVKGAQARIAIEAPDDLFILPEEFMEFIDGTVAPVKVDE